MYGRSLPPNFGIVPDAKHNRELAENAYVIFGSPLDHLKADMDKSVFGHRCLTQMLKRNPKYVTRDPAPVRMKARNQSSHGSCVGHGEAGKIKYTLACGHYMRGEEIGWPTSDDDGKLLVEPSPSWLYGASRQSANQLGKWEGSNGSWAAKATEEMGFLFEKNYPGAVDLTEYKPRDCNNWEANGVPARSLEVADDQLLKGMMQIKSCEELVACYQAGYGVNTCNDRSPRKTRDEYGRCDLTGRWAHSVTGVPTYVVYKISPTKTLRLFLIENSHGNNSYTGPKGPKTPDISGGGYFLEWKDMQTYLNSGDTWVNFSLDGLKPASRTWEKRLREK